MRPHLALVVVVLAFPEGARGATPSSPLPAIPGDEGTFTLRDGGTVSGQLFAIGEGGDRVVLPDGAQRYLPEGAIIGASEIRVRADESTRLLVGRSGGESATGTFLRADATEIAIRLRDRKELAIPISDVRFVEFAGRVQAGSIWTRLPSGGPARDRTMLAPTALRLEQGEIEFSLTGLVQPTLSFGILPWLSASAWTVIPMMQASGWGATGALRVDAGLAVTAWLHLDAGVQGVLEAGGATVAPILAVTAGGPGGYGNLALAPVPVGAAVDGQFDKGALAASGGFRATSFLVLLAEGWLGKSVTGDLSYMVGAAGRLHWSVAALELGAFYRGGGGPFLFASIVLDMNPFRAAEGS